MKKLISVLIAIEMFFLSIGIQAFAATNQTNNYNNSELDLSKYTLGDYR